MKDKRLFMRCLGGTFGIFLLLWGAAMAALVWVNWQWTSQDVLTQRYQLPNAILMGDTSFNWESETAEEKGWISCQLTVSGCENLKDYGGQVFVRAYDKEGGRLGQSQMLTATATLYSEDDIHMSEAIFCRMLLDQAMTDEQLVEAARFMNRRGTGYYLERIGMGVPIGGGSEVVGWLKDNVFYVQTLTLQLEEEQVVLGGSDVDLFPGQEPATYRIGWVEFSTPLTGRGGPEKRLEQYREMEADVDDLEELNQEWGKGPLIAANNPSNASLISSGAHAVAYSYCLSPYYALTGLGPAALLTLGAAVFLALLTAWLEYRAIRRERAFTRAAAHELKTPLAILRAHAESLKEDIDPAKREEYLDVVLSETDRMTALTGALLDLARLERGEALVREPVELSALVKGVFDQLALPLERKGVALRLELSPLWTEGDRTRLESVVENLASNALRYGTPGGVVTVKLAKEGRWAALTVDNDGENIPERELHRLWRPFYRGDQSRSRDTGGTGLGLAIVKAAVKAHRGDCAVSNRDGGVTFRVWLPGLQSAQ